MCAPKLYNDLPLDVGHFMCASKLYNNLPLNVRNAVSLNSFKSGLKTIPDTLCRLIDYFYLYRIVKRS